MDDAASLTRARLILNPDVALPESDELESDADMMSATTGVTHRIAVSPLQRDHGLETHSANRFTPPHIDNGRSTLIHKCLSTNDQLDADYVEERAVEELLLLTESDVIENLSPGVLSTTIPKISLPRIVATVTYASLDRNDNTPFRKQINTRLSHDKPYSGQRIKPFKYLNNSHSTGLTDVQHEVKKHIVKQLRKIHLFAVEAGLEYASLEGEDEESYADSEGGDSSDHDSVAYERRWIFI